MLLFNTMDDQEKTEEVNEEVTDISGELQRKREEALKKRIEQRKIILLNLLNISNFLRLTIMSLNFSEQ